MKKAIVFLILTVTWLSAMNGQNTAIEFLPFRSQPHGRWGLISPTGKVLFAERFRNQPTACWNGRFAVENEQGLWEIFTAEAKPRRVGEAYESLVPFLSPATVASLPGGPVMLIDRNGQVRKHLDVIGGKTVEAVCAFHEGVAVFLTVDGCSGVIDTTGNVVLPPVYDRIMDAADGKLIVWRKDVKEAIDTYNPEHTTLMVFDTRGNLLGQFPRSSVEGILGSFSQGVLPVNIRQGEDWFIGLLDAKGEYVVPPTIPGDQIMSQCAGMVTFTDGETECLLHKDGSTGPDSLFSYLRLVAADRLVAIPAASDSNGGYRLTDLEGNDVGTARFESYAYGFIGRHLPVETAPGCWNFLRHDGSLVGLDGQRVAEIGLCRYDDVAAVSHTISADTLVSNLRITRESIGPFSFNTRPEQVAPLYGLPLTPGQFVYTDKVRHTLEIGPARAHLLLCFDDTMARAPTPAAAALANDGVEGTGCRFTDARPDFIRCVFHRNDIPSGNLRSVFDALTRKAATLGHVIRREANTWAIDIGSGRVAIVYHKNDYTGILMRTKSPTGFEAGG